MVSIGYIDEHELKFDVESDELHCKDNFVSAEVVIQAFKSQLDRVMLKKGLIYRKTENNYTIGCLALTSELIVKFYKQIKQLRRDARTQKT